MRLDPLHSSARFGTTVQENLTILIDLDYSGLGPTPKDVAAAVRQACGIILPGENLAPLTPDNYYEAVQDHYARFLRNDSSGRAALIFLCYFSSYYHELRHVHDLLGSRTGQLLFYNAFNVFQNTPHLLNLLWDWQENHPKERIPLPLARWADSFSGFSPDMQTIFKGWAKASDIFGQMHEEDRQSTGMLTIAHLLETSAVNVQLDFVHDVLGDEAVNRLSQTIEQEGNAALYLQIRNEAFEAFEAAGYEGGDIGTLLNHLVWVALNQTAPLNDLEAALTPVRYFEFLKEEVLHRIPAGAKLDVAGLVRAVNEICDEWGVATPDRMRQETRARLSMRVDRIRQARAAEQGRNAADILESVVQQFDAIHNLTVASPALMGQRPYVWAVLYGVLPSVHVKVRFDGIAQDLMSIGKRGVSAEDWGELAVWGSTFRVLADGTGRTYPPFFEEICFRTLTQPDQGRRSLRFYNPSLQQAAAAR